MHCLLRQHALLEEINIAVGIARHKTILCRRWLVILRLPMAKDLERLIFNDGASELRGGKSIVEVVFYKFISDESTYLIPLRTSLDNLVGLLAQPHHTRALEPYVPGVQQMHTIAGVDRLAAYETQRGRIGRIDTLEFE